MRRNLVNFYALLIWSRPLRFITALVSRECLFMWTVSVFSNRFSFVNKCNEMRARGTPRAGSRSNYRRRGGAHPRSRNQPRSQHRSAEDPACALLSNPHKTKTTRPKIELIRNRTETKQVTI